MLNIFKRANTTIEERIEQARQSRTQQRLRDIDDEKSRFEQKIQDILKTIPDLIAKSDGQTFDIVGLPQNDFYLRCNSIKPITLTECLVEKLRQLDLNSFVRTCNDDYHYLVVYL